MSEILDTFAQLLRELPPNAVAVRYISRTYTAADMAAEIETGTVEDKQYVSDCLREAC